MLMMPIPETSDHEHPRALSTRGHPIHHLARAPDRDRLLVRRRNVEPLGQDRADFMLRIFDQRAIPELEDQHADDRFVDPGIGEDRDMGRQRDPDLIVDLVARASELGADAAQDAHHLKGGTVDPNPASDMSLHAQQFSSDVVSEHHDPPPQIDIALPEGATSGQRCPTNRDAVGFDAADLGVERTLSERDRAVSDGLAGDVLWESRTSSERLDVFERVPERATIDGRCEIF